MSSPGLCSIKNNSKTINNAGMLTVKLIKGSNESGGRKDSVEFFTARPFDSDTCNKLSVILSTAVKIKNAKWECR
jgi:hypothetical protein